ncbi:cysteine desulfurase [Candidatus Saccharibacteria bacterium]|nr:cysteine desulfurase [Candidatus Saccharibacteria bacterium]
MTDQPQHAIYLDHAAATPMSDGVLEAMQPFFAGRFYNPSALYLAAKDVHHQLEIAREAVASILGARPGEVVFTAGGTEANNLAISGVMQQFPDGNIVTTAIEHDSVLRPAAQYKHCTVGVSSGGVTDLQELEKTIDAQTVLVSVMYANNETGVIQPLTSVARLVQDIRRERIASGNLTPLYLHTDACQAANYLPLTKARLGIDLMTLNGGKIYGPKQSGCLFVRAGVKLNPQILGGGQERGARSGTENVPAIMGFAHALSMAQARRDEESNRLRELQRYFIQQLSLQLPSVVVTGSLQETTSSEEAAAIIAKHPDALARSLPAMLPNFVHIRITGADNERLIMELDERGIMAAAGSACSASSDEPSHVLQSMGLSEVDAQSSIRFTMGQSTTREDIDTVVKTLAAIDPMLYTVVS